MDVAEECPCCDAVGVDTRHARVCPRARNEANKRQSVLHVVSRTVERLWIFHRVQAGEPFAADRNLKISIVVRTDGLQDAPNRGDTRRSPS